ncbi:MAG: N-6 DNA methylase [Burkholderiales bacterium]|nr:N-6 DNA methylase [Burkholderiales bacterium]
MTKPLSWNEIKSRALKFSKTWADASNEDSEAKPFLIDFFEIFGITNKRIATFEHAVKKYGGKQGFVDLFWTGVLLVEMKSRGRDLTRAYDQAMGYFDGIKESDLPRYILVSDFARFALTDLETNQTIEFKLEDLHKEVKNFGFIAGYTTQIIVAQDPINIKAAERMGKLHDSLKAIGYDGHALELYLVRLLFCLFAEDTSIYHKRQFQDYIENRTAQDGSDLAHHLSTLFYILNTPEDKRLKNLDEDLAAFPYVNGKLFAEPLPPASFDTAMRDALLDACALDWSRISPAIFGSLFQSIMDKEARRNLGAHYTSEENIQKLIKPLFLDALWDEFNRIHKNPAKLNEFHERLARMSFLDPACGCGNFLVITYRELRKLELEILKKLHKTDQLLEIDTLTKLNVNQFYGIEIEEFPAQIAQVALWLTDHQMNQQTSEVFGAYFARIPLTHSATIVHGNALQIDWNEVCPNASYIIGNPPFIGAKFMGAEQRRDANAVFGNIKNAGLLDFVCCWHVKATRYMQEHPSTQTALVSTNSICQGEQVGTLWGWMLAQGVNINFAHRTFSWTNEARGKAAVCVIIVGFSVFENSEKTLFFYDDIKGEPYSLAVKHINPYLVDAPNVLLENRSKPLGNLPEIGIGNKPIDGGNYLFTEDEYQEFIVKEPNAKPYFKKWLGADEFLNGWYRYCLWLGDCPPNILKTMPNCLSRVEAVRQFRLASKSVPTQKLAVTPTRFHVENMPECSYIIIPKVSSDKRTFIPIGFENEDTLSSDLVFLVPNATIFHFGVLTSTMHNAWMRAVAGRLGNGYRYSAGIVYNNYPWPNLTDKQQQNISDAAQIVLDARTLYPEASLADLYDPRTMPPELTRAHAKLDKAVDTAYGFKSNGGGANDAERVAFLFTLYQKLQGELTQLAAEKPRTKTRKGKALTSELE